MNGIDLGLKLCLVCYRVSRESRRRCPRCGGRVYTRRRNSIQRSWALTLAGGLLYIPANILPMMTISWLGQGGQPDTILSGVVKLIHHDMMLIAALVFIVSIVIPLFKLLGMSVLLLSIPSSVTISRDSPSRFSGFWQGLFGSRLSGYKTGLTMGQKMQLYRVIAWIGRWSMLDIFIISLLAGLVQFGQLGQVEPGMGAWAFAAVVILTMLASDSFDPRLLWDAEAQKSVDLTANKS